MSDVVLTVNGKRYPGWKSVSIARSIETISGQFRLEVSQNFPLQREAWPIRSGDECSVSISGQIAITGFVDTTEIAHDSGDHSFSVSGRDKSADLVDCSVDLGSWELKKQPRFDVIQKIAAQYGVKVTLGAGVSLPPPKDKFALNPGEAAFDALDRMCRECGVLPVSDGRGGIVLSKPGQERATDALRLGHNILKGRSMSDASGRFSKYRVLAQRPGSDDTFGKDAAAVKGTAEDADARSGRTLVVRAENAMTPEEAKARAAWEASVRAARADEVEITVQGHVQSDGKLWPLNGLIPVRDHFLGIDREMLIVSTVFQVDGGTGTTTQLSLKLPQAFASEPIPKAAK